MKKRICFLLLIPMLIVGCGEDKNTNTWDNESNFGEINIDAETVDIYSVNEEYEIDKYVKIEELNLTKPDNITEETYRLPYNKIGEQFGLPYILLSESEQVDESDNIITHKYTKEGIGVYIKVNKNDNRIMSIYSEFKFNDNPDSFYDSVGRIFAQVYGGMPNLKKYDLNKIFFEIADAMQEEKGTYKTSYNNISLEVKRDYGYVYVTTTYPFELNVDMNPVANFSE